MDKKKIAAAMAAVYMHIRTVEEAAAAAAQAPVEPVVEPAVTTGMIQNAWGISGRQAMMNAGSMMQMRMFK